MLSMALKKRRCGNKMSKSYTSYIESELRKNNFGNIAKLAYQFGKYKGCPIQMIETKLKEWVKDLRELRNDDITIAQMIDEEWLNKKASPNSGE